MARIPVIWMLAVAGFYIFNLYHFGLGAGVLIIGGVAAVTATAFVALGVKESRDRTDRGQAAVDHIAPAALIIILLTIYTLGLGLGIDHIGAAQFTGVIGLLALVALALYQHYDGELGVQDSRSRGDQDRGAITIPDVVMYAVGIFVLGALVPVLMPLVNANASIMSRGTELFILGAIPLTVLVFFAVIFRKAVSP